ncbi:MAG: hypothetical protein ACR2PL_05195 [Dehalococcoidia bacterium]
MTQGLVVDGDEVNEEPSCRHHWKIAPPNGATSLGTCKVCGEEREFRNSSTDSIWENESGESAFNRGRGRAATEPIAEENSQRRPAPALGSLLGRRYNEEA